MSRLDLVIFGATGFTGKHAVKQLTNIIKEYPLLTWGIAGRSRNKLESTLQEASIFSDVSAVRIITADIEDEQSLKEMCAQAKVVVNCSGPYRMFGEPVVKAAIENNAHYVDVSGEPQFIETMQLKYNEAAREAGVYIISACGFDSIPADLGVVFLEQNFGGTLNSVEMYLSVSISASLKDSGCVNFGTWESLVYAMAFFGELTSLRKKLYPCSLPDFKPRLKRRMPLHKRNQKWCVPMFEPDDYNVYRTQRYRYEVENKRPVQFYAHLMLPKFLYALLIAFFAGLVFVMSKTRFTRNLVLKYPHVFTFGFVRKESPNEKVTESTTVTFDLYGKGWPEGADVDKEPPTKKVAARVTGTNPGYGMTVIALLYSAVIILTEQDKMPDNGGVITPGIAFQNTSLVRRLTDNNVNYEIITNEKNIS